MRQYGIRIANVALFALCSFFAASVFNQIAAEMLIPMPETAAPLTRERAADQPTWAERKIVIDRNLFGSRLVSDAPPPPPPVEEEIELEETALPVKLLGTVAGGDASVSTAAISDSTIRTHQILRIGDFLEGRDDVRVAAIERKRVVLQNGLKMEELLLDEDAPRARPAKKGGAARRKSVRRRQAGKPGASSRARRKAEMLETRVRELESELDGGTTARLAAQFAKLTGGDPASTKTSRRQSEIFSQARILPKYDDGQMVGLELNAIKPGSIYEKLGLSNGDVIKELNGIQINNPALSSKLLDEFSSAKEFHIMVEGPNGVQPLNVSSAEVKTLLGE